MAQTWRVSSPRWVKTATCCTVLRCAGCVCPVCFGDLQSDDAHTFLISVEKVSSIPFAGEASLQCLQRRALLDLETPVVVKASQVGTGLIGVQLVKVLGARTLITAQQKRSLASEWAHCECCGGTTMCRLPISWAMTLSLRQPAFSSVR